MFLIRYGILFVVTMSMLFCQKNDRKLDQAFGKEKGSEQTTENIESKFLDFYYKQYPKDSVELTEHSIILSGKSFALPNFEEKIENKWYGKNHLYEFEIELTKNNQVSYHYQIHNLGNKQIIRGVAWLQPFFYLASETDENQISEEAYPVYEYTSEQEKTSIALRIGKDSKGYAMKLTVSSEIGNEPDVSLDRSPIMRLANTP